MAKKKQPPAPRADATFFLSLLLVLLSFAGLCFAVRDLGTAVTDRPGNETAEEVERAYFEQVNLKR